MIVTPGPRVNWGLLFRVSEDSLATGLRLNAQALYLEMNRLATHQAPQCELVCASRAISESQQAGCRMLP